MDRLPTGAFKARNATIQDLPLLLDLEKKWPEESRATADALRRRIEKFSAGYFVAEDKTGIIGSIISYPYSYNPSDLSNFQNWDQLVQSCYATDQSPSPANALYIISGTSNNPHHEANFFNEGINLMLALAEKMKLTYVIAGALLPGYASFVEKNKPISAKEYVFKKNGRRFVDPLIEKYRRMGFSVPDSNHVIANYFPDPKSLNYSALVVKNVR
jgi:hypothetical protein